MSLTTALHNALSGTRVAQGSLAVVSQNIANAGVEGYSRKTANVETAVHGGLTMGAIIDSVRRAASDQLSAQLSRELSSLERLTTLDEYYQRIDDLFGAPDKAVGLNAMLTKFAEAATNFEVDPSSTAAQREMVNAAQSLTAGFRTATRDLQAVREQADGAIGAAVGELNKHLAQINRLNGEIAIARAEGQSFGDLEDARDKAVREISKLMDVRVFGRPNGAIALTTPTGQVLLDDQMVQKFSFRPSIRLQPGVNYSDGVSTPPFGVIMGEAPGMNMNSIIGDGRIRALIDVRDRIGPEIQQRLESLATVVRDQVNELHNQGSSAHPLQMLRGSAPLGANADLGQAEGIVEFAVLDRSSGVASSVIQIDLGQLRTLLAGMGSPLTPQAIADVINGDSPHAASVIVSQIPAFPSVPRGLADARAHIDTTGRFVLSSAVPTKGVVVNSVPAMNPAAELRSSDIYGALGDVIGPGGANTVFEVAVTDTATGIETGRIRINLATPAPNQIQTIGDLINAVNGLNPDAILYQVPANTGGAAGTVGGPGLATATASLNGSGQFTITAADPRHRLDVVANDFGTPGSGSVDIPAAAVTGPAKVGPQQRNLSSVLGLNDFFSTEDVDRTPGATVAGVIEVRRDLVTNPAGLSHGRLQAVRSGAAGGITYRVASGDGSIANAISKAMTDPVRIDGRDWGSMNAYSGDIIVTTSLAVSNNKTQLAYQEDLHDNLKQQLTSITGVNMDEEMANLVSLQNSYQASARVITVIQQLFEELTSIVR